MMQDDHIFHVVLDTSILLDEKVPKLCTLLKHNYPNIKIIIPYIVLVELDMLKMSSNSKKVQLAKQAIYHLHELMVKNNYSWIRGQNPTFEYLSFVNTKTDKECKTNIHHSRHDQILQCVFYFLDMNKTQDIPLILITREDHLHHECSYFNIVSMDLFEFNYAYAPTL